MRAAERFESENLGGIEREIGERRSDVDSLPG